MILNNVPHGNCRVPKIIVFGKGSLAVNYNLFDAGVGAVLIIDRTNSPGVVGESTGEGAGMSTDEMNIDTMLAFENVEGLDVLVDALIEIRKQMVEFKNR